MTAPAPNPKDTPMTLDQKIRDRLDQTIDTALEERNGLTSLLPGTWTSNALQAVYAVLDLHNEFRIYDDCGHQHTEAGNGVLDVENVGLTCSEGYEYSICRSCCADGGAYQTEDCASHERPCWPCPTHHTIASALGIDLAAVTG